MEHTSSAKSLVGKLQPNIESLDKNWTFFPPSSAVWFPVCLQLPELHRALKE